MSRIVTLFKAANGRKLTTLLLALWKLFRHRDTPRAAKAVALLTVAYAVSPIDLIPDFIPVLGQLDDVIIVPLGIALAIRLTPAPLWQARLAEAEASREKLPRLVWGAALVMLFWAAVGGALLWWAIGSAQAATPPAAKKPAPPPREIAGTVTRVVDGDTLWLAPSDDAAAAPLVVRIEGIDAPEICQDWGHQAKEALADKVLQRAVTVRPVAHDDWGRTVGKVYLGDEDVGDRLVRDGHAWSQRVRSDRGPYVAEERMATALKRGLHASGGAVMPKDFRRVNGPCEPAGASRPGVGH